ncbi:MAG: hypothetical protein ABR912_10115 [Terracidiphilus sp.]|jgi:hypothetical protein
MESELKQDRPAEASVKPVSRFLRFGLASIAALVLSGIILGITYAARMFPGYQIQWAETEVRLIVPFALAVGIAAAAYPRRWLSPRGSAFIVAAVGAVVGCLCCLVFPGWMILLSGLSNLHFGWGFLLGARLPLAFELQAAAWLIAAGASAMLVTFTRRKPIVLVAVTMLCLLAIVLPSPVFDLLTNNQELTVAFVIPASSGASAAKPPRAFSSGPQWLNEAGANAVAAHVLEALRTSGLPGQYRVAEVYRCGTGKKSLQIIVLNPPVPALAHLPQPDGTELIYVAKPDGWETIPSRAPTLGRSVEVRGPRTGLPYLATSCIPNAAGSGPCPAIRPD